jgi:hypothetical protein
VRAGVTGSKGSICFKVMLCPYQTNWFGSRSVTEQYSLPREIAASSTFRLAAMWESCRLAHARWCERRLCSQYHTSCYVCTSKVILNKIIHKFSVILNKYSIQKLAAHLVELAAHSWKTVGLTDSVHILHSPSYCRCAVRMTHSRRHLFCPWRALICRETDWLN